MLRVMPTNVRALLHWRRVISGILFRRSLRSAEHDRAKAACAAVARRRSRPELPGSASEDFARLHARPTLSTRCSKQARSGGCAHEEDPPSLSHVDGLDGSETCQSLRRASVRASTSRGMDRDAANDIAALVLGEQQAQSDGSVSKSVSTDGQNTPGDDLSEGVSPGSGGRI